jgi:AmiR/NasT family two-component response regulator
MNQLASLRGQRALVLHPEGQSRSNLIKALASLEMSTSVAWPSIGDNEQPVQVVFFDVDRGHDEQFPWKKGANLIPMIALIGSEAPGRIEWAISHHAAAYLLKPIHSAGVFSALTIAFHQFSAQQENHRQIQNLSSRLKARPLVLKVVLDEMVQNNIDDDEAFKRIRTRSMECQLSVEEYCAGLLSQSVVVSAHPRIRKQ